MEKNAPVRSALLRVQLSVEFRTEQLRMMLEKGFMTPEDQGWLVPFLDPARKSPVQLKLKRRRRGRSPAFPGAEGDALWGPLLGKLDMSELVRCLIAPQQSSLFLQSRYTPLLLWRELAAVER